MLKQIKMENVFPLYNNELDFSRINVFFGESNHILKFLYHIRKYLTISNYDYPPKFSIPSNLNYLFDQLSHEWGVDTDEKPANIDVIFRKNLTLHASSGKVSFGEDHLYKGMPHYRDTLPYSHPLYIPAGGLIHLFGIESDFLEPVYTDMFNIMKIDDRRVHWGNNMSPKGFYPLYKISKGEMKSRRDSHYFERKGENIPEELQDKLKTPVHWMTTQENVLATLQWLAEKGWQNESCLFWEQVNTPDVVGLIGSMSWQNQTFLTTTNKELVFDLIREMQMQPDDIRIFQQEKIVFDYKI